MAKKNLIISAFTKYNFAQLSPYIKSIDENVSNCDKVMVIGDSDSQTRVKLEQYGWHLIDLPLLQEIPIHVLRFLPMYEYLREHYDQYEYVVSTDVKDVVFQQDPFAWLQGKLGDKKLVAGSEALRYKHEPWGDDNLRSTYGGYVYEHFKDNVIYNVGTLGGLSEYMRDLFFNLFFNSLSRPISIVDQAVFNVLIQTKPYADSVLFAEQRDGWACQAGTVADPTKMHYFRPNLLEPEPNWHGGAVLTNDNKLFVIVHQYDRVPEWKQFYDTKYR